MDTWVGPGIFALLLLLGFVAARRGIRSHAPGVSAPTPTSVEDLAAGRKVEAIKRYHELHRVGLKEAKDAVEALGRGLPPR